ncbi:Dol-P-Man [Coniochaeta hoffmannii]|uniref:Dol-P-Man:Man(5)GlcNAc(2)-PP-Dol alpha-1,3-mannosyltransferase n=1 Tax=Coniochaeta hoffmannii TaxID=91930 RepID=A0AA38R803_9PEZI|nr:Dol-P-Man [Coniochaeta hoffmannii]
MDWQRPWHQRAIPTVLAIANGRHPLSKLIPPAIVLLDVLLCLVIIRRVQYTEIDWEAYMQQVSQFVAGERDYTKMEGGTGPLVYPAVHVWIYTALYAITDQGKNILLAQYIFGGLYIASLVLVMACYWKAKAPPYIFPLLILSKRLHSIFLLRCFNDGFAVYYLWVATLLFQNRYWTLGAIFYSVGLGVKMSLLLVLPAVGIILLLGRGFRPAVRLAWLIAQIQLVTALPFLANNPWGYLARAFEFSRQFLFKWTVNWRFVGEETFLSRWFSLLLLGLHASTLVAFIANRWLKPARKSLVDIVGPMLFFESPFSGNEALDISTATTPQYILTTVLTANVIGLLFARSLHYQFYAYLAWSTPYLLWRSGIHPVLIWLLFFVQEWAWNVYPSTPASSFAVVGMLGLTVALVWRGARAEYEPARIKDAAAKH